MKPNPDCLDPMPAGYRFLRRVFTLIFRLLARCEVIGRENVPPRGALLVVSNHLSYADPPLILMGVPRRLTGFVAEKYRRNPFIRLLNAMIGGIWIRQSEADLGALREALAYLKSGRAMGLALEGTRSRVHGLVPGKSGGAYLAERAGAPILPVACVGTDHTWGEVKRLRRPRIRLVIGRAFQLPATDRGRAERLGAYTDIMMCHVAALLPAHYRGVYAQHAYLPQAIAYQRGGLKGE